ncbi:MAG: cobyric acid synthase CobQ, partial [Nitrospirae bacterium]
LVIIPGTKSTIRDLEFLKSHGIDETLKEAISRGVPLMGICGGYQMLGESLRDHNSVESDIKETSGLGFLPISTDFDTQKTTTQVVARQVGPIFGEVMTKEPLWGYEIHMGNTEVPSGHVFTGQRLATGDPLSDGMSSSLVSGTYLHGIFENDPFRVSLINFLRRKKGLPERPLKVSYRRLREEVLDRVTDLVTGAMDMGFVESLVE